MKAALDPVSQENVTRTELQHKKKEKDFDILNQFKGRDGLFLKAFFVDATLNENGWRVTDQAIVRDIHTAMQSDYFGKTATLIMRADFGHPPDDSPDIVAAQEPDRVGNFLAVGIDDKTGHGYFIAEVTEPKAIKALAQTAARRFVGCRCRRISDEDWRSEFRSVGETICGCRRHTRRAALPWPIHPGVGISDID